tara:strand:+ start:1087 stop:1221 length:135 start_codon:yes stop_codon:yes gene_type:complete
MKKNGIYLINQNKTKILFIKQKILELCIDTSYEIIHDPSKETFI